MVAGRDAIFRFRVDDRQFNAKVKNAITVTNQLNNSAGNASMGLDKMGGSLGKTGTNAAASAVNFQTATQGMLNLSTAAVQTYTSISNLDRANNRAKMSTIAVARAEDLLANKKERLNSLVESGAKGSQKYLNIQKEIITAEADLTVKTEKMGIEQAAVNDIYMLFAANVANVTISSLQTITILVGQEKVAKVAATLATKLHTFATWDNVRAHRANTLGTLSAVGALRVNRSAQLSSIITTKGLTVATKALTVAMGPIGLLLVGISAAWAIHESNLIGSKTALDNMLGVQEDETAEILKQREELDALNSSLDQHITKVQRLPKTYSEAESFSKKYTETLKQQRIELSKTFGGSAADLFPNASLGGNPDLPWGVQVAYGSSTGEGSGLPTTISSVQSGQFAPNGQPLATDDYRYVSGFDFIKGFVKARSGSGRFANNGFTLRTNTGRQFGTKGFEVENEKNDATYQALNESASKELGYPVDISDPNVFSQLPEGLQSQITSLFKSMETNSILFGLGANIKEDLDLAKFGKVSTFATREAAIQRTAEDDLRSRVDAITQKNAGRAGLSTKEYLRRKELGGLAGKARAGMPNFKTSKMNLATAIRRNQLKGIGLPDDTPHDRLVAAALNAKHPIWERGIYGEGLVLSKDDKLLRSAAGMGPIQGQVYMDTGVNIGKVAETVGVENAKRIAETEKGLSFFANTRGGQSLGLNTYLAQQAQPQLQRNIINALGSIFNRNSLGGNQATNYFGGGFFKSTGATAAFQVPRGSIKIDPIHTTRRLIRDNNLNRLRNGGTRIVDEFGQPLFHIAEEGAVEGGYTSLQALRVAQKQEFRRDAASARSFLALTGVGVGVSNAMMNNFNTHAQRAISQAQSQQGLLARTGLSLSGLPRVLRARRGRGQYSAYREHKARLGVINRANRAAAIQANLMTLKRAGQIDLLEGGFGLSGFYGSGAGTYQSLVDEVAHQDELISSIGLNRTEAFRIIDTSGRGRTEIDDRIRWVERMDIISTGNSVL